MFVACPAGYYGQTCSFHCSGNNEDYCRSLLICLPDPYGCSCYSGWYGIHCNQSKSLFTSPFRSLLDRCQLVLWIVMALVVPINVLVTTVIDSPDSVIVMEQNVIKASQFTSDTRPDGTSTRSDLADKLHFVIEKMNRERETALESDLFD